MQFASLDVYPKTLNEFRHRTLSGAVVSIACALLILALTAIEVVDFAQVRTLDHLFVDTSRGQQMRVNLNISFPALPCSVLTLDTLDVSGNHVPDLMSHVQKTRLDAHGKALEGGEVEPPPRKPFTLNMPMHGSPFGNLADDKGPAGGRRLLGLRDSADSQPARKLPPRDVLSNHFQQPDSLLSHLLAELVPQIFEDKGAITELQKHVGEGCHIVGFLMVNRVAGNFHFGLTHADHHVLMKVFKDRESLNVSHFIHSISFGEPYPGMVNPLDKSPKLLDHGSGYFQYYIKVVPTIYESLMGKVLHTNQFSYTELFRTTKEVDKLPAVYFHYEISPIMAKVSQERRSITSFLTGLCAIIGGVFTVAGMVDSCIYRASRLVGSASRQ